MIICRCLGKKRDKRGNIEEYILETKNGAKKILKSKALKSLIKQGKIGVLNLTLTSDNRLVDGANQKVKAELERQKKRAAKPLKVRPKAVKQSEASKVEKTEKEYYELTQSDISEIKSNIDSLLTTYPEIKVSLDTANNLDEINKLRKSLNSPLSSKYKITLNGEIMSIAKANNPNTIIFIHRKENTFLRLPANCTKLFKDFRINDTPLETLTINCDWSGVYTTAEMFNCANIKHIKLVGKAEKLLDMYKMFNCETIGEQFIRTVDLSDFTATHVTRTARMFSNPKMGIDPSLRSVPEVLVKLGGLNLSHVINAVGMIGNSSLTSEDLIRHGLKNETKLNQAKTSEYIGELNLSDKDKEITEKYNLKIFSIGKQKGDYKRKSKTAKEEYLLTRRLERAKAEGKDTSNFETAINLHKIKSHNKSVLNTQDNFPNIYTRFIAKLFDSSVDNPHNSYHSDIASNIKCTDVVKYQTVIYKLGININNWGLEFIDLKDLTVLPIRYEPIFIRTRIGNHKRSIVSHMGSTREDIMITRSTIAYGVKNTGDSRIKLPTLEVNKFGKIERLKTKYIGPGEESIITRHDLLLLLVLSKQRQFKNGIIQWQSAETKSELTRLPYIRTESYDFRINSERRIVKATDGDKYGILNYSRLWYNEYEQPSNRINRTKYKLDRVKGIADILLGLSEDVSKACSENSGKPSKIRMIDVGGTPTSGSIADIFNECRIITFLLDRTLVVYIPKSVKYLNINPSSDVYNDTKYTHSFYKSIRSEYGKDNIDKLVVCGGEGVEDIAYMFYNLNLKVLDLRRFRVNKNAVQSLENAFTKCKIEELQVPNRDFSTSVIDLLEKSALQYTRLPGVIINWDRALKTPGSGTIKHVKFD